MKNFLSTLTRFRKADHGQVVLMVALGMFFMLLIAGLGVDVGYLRYEKHQMQKAADAGAIGAATAMSLYGTGQSQVTVAGQADATANGWANDANNTGGVKVYVNNPPTTAGDPFVGNSQYVEVIVSQPRPTFFMHVGGFGSQQVSARAVAGLRSASGCIYVLDPVDKDSYLQSGSTTVQSACGIQVNSSNTSAFEDTGAACTDATYIHVHGGDNNGNWKACTVGGRAPVLNSPVIPDPLAGVQAPSLGACVPGGKLTVNASTPEPIQPGTYCGGITVQPTAGTVTFATGTYILAGGGLTIAGGVTVNGTGVTFFNTKNPANGSYGQITISGGLTTVTLSAPTSGALRGILFFDDRTIPYTSSRKSQITGGANTYLTGALYFPTTHLIYSGGSSDTAYTNIVAYQLEITGNSTINDSTTDTYGAPGIATIATVE